MDSTPILSLIDYFFKTKFRNSWSYISELAKNLFAWIKALAGKKESLRSKTHTSPSGKNTRQERCHDAVHHEPLRHTGFPWTEQRMRRLATTGLGPWMDATWLGKWPDVRPLFRGTVSASSELADWVNGREEEPYSSFGCPDNSKKRTTRKEVTTHGESWEARQK